MGTNFAIGTYQTIIVMASKIVSPADIAQVSRMIWTFETSVQMTPGIPDEDQAKFDALIARLKEQKDRDDQDAGFTEIAKAFSEIEAISTPPIQATIAVLKEK